MPKSITLYSKQEFLTLLKNNSQENVAEWLVQQFQTARLDIDSLISLIEGRVSYEKMQNFINEYLK